MPEDRKCVEKQQNLPTELPVVFRYPWLVNTVYLSVVALLLGWLFGFRLHQPIAAAIPVMFPLRAAAERRRKIVLSADAIEYRPVFGKPRKSLFCNVISIRSGLTCTFFFFKAQQTLGAVIQGPGDWTLVIPLDMPGGENIFPEIIRAWERYGAQMTAEPRSL